MLEKFYLIILLILLFTPFVYAEEEDSSWISEIASSILEKIGEVISKVINAPIEPLTELTRNLLSAVINLDLFKDLWAIILYILSMFYSLLLLYSGFNFIISGHDIVKRENAKTWLKNIVIMIVLVQGSFFFYKVMIELSSILTTAILNMIPNNFFLITFESGLDLLFYLTYLIVLLITSLLLVIRYFIVSFGVVFFPIAIFLYFIPFTKDYGKVILNFLSTCIFISFFNAIILLCSSRLIFIPLFQHYKIIVMISSFALISLVTFYFMLFNLIKSGVNTASSVIHPVKNLL